MIIHQGEQYKMAFDVFLDDVKATPEDIDGLRIKIGDRLLEYPDGELEFDLEMNRWLYPLTSYQTRTLRSETAETQVAARISSDIVMTDVFELDVRKSIIKEPWV